MIRGIRVAGDAGVTLIELLVATAITLTVSAGVFMVVSPAHGIFAVQPEAADTQQRLRVSVNAVAGTLDLAGAGMDAGPAAGMLLDYFAPLLPYRIGLANSDPVAGRYFRPDAISVLWVPPTASQAITRTRLEVSASQLELRPLQNCPQPRLNSLCGFEKRMRVLLFDPSGAWDLLTITDLQDPSLRVQYPGALSVPYPAGSPFTAVEAHTYYLKNDATGEGTYQLMHYDGYQTDLPVVDNVVKLEFSYFGDPRPPVLRPGKPLDAALGPFTTYGPKPPLLDRDNPDDSWDAGENCLFAVQDGGHVPRLPTLDAGTVLVELQQNMLVDGPWCPDAGHANRFDADLLRIRRVHVKLRVQAAAASLRGPAGVLFMHGGTGRTQYVPDQEISIDVTPRNLNAGR